MMTKVIAIALLLFSVFSGANAQTTPAVPIVLDVAWSPDGTKLAVAGTDGLQVINTTTNQDLQEFQATSVPVYVAAWSPDGRQLASTGENGQIDLWDANTGHIQASLSGHEARVTSLKWSPDGTRLASTSAGIDETFSLRTWDMTDFLPLAMFDASYLAEVVWTPDSSHLIVANTILGAYIFDSDLRLSSSQGITQYQIGPDEPIGAVAISPDGQVVALASFAEPVIYLWDITTNQMLQVLRGHTDFVLEIDWNPSNDSIASVSLDGTLIIWDAETGELINRLNVGSPLYAVAWSPDGNRLAYGGELAEGETQAYRIIEM